MRTVLAVVAAIITIFTFATGIVNLPQLFSFSETSKPDAGLPLERVISTPNAITPAEVSKLSTGAVTIKTMGEFSFSMGKVVARGGDITFTWHDRRLIAKGGGIVALGSQSLDEIDQIPVSKSSFLSSNYSASAKLIVGQSYAILTADQVHYAKLRVTNMSRDSRGYYLLTFDWVYQANGSPIFAP